MLPVAKGRPRCSKMGRAYTPAKTRQAEEDFKYLLMEKWKRKPTDKPVMLSIVFYMPIPKSWSKVKQHNIVGEPHGSRPDLDNLIKLVTDAMNGIVYTDDSLVWAITSSKQYGTEPHIEIQVISYDY